MSDILEWVAKEASQTCQLMIRIMEKTKSGEGIRACLGKVCDFQWMVSEHHKKKELLEKGSKKERGDSGACLEYISQKVSQI